MGSREREIDRQTERNKESLYLKKKKWKERNKRISNFSCVGTKSIKDWLMNNRKQKQNKWNIECNFGMNEWMLFRQKMKKKIHLKLIILSENILIILMLKGAIKLHCN